MFVKPSAIRFFATKKLPRKKFGRLIRVAPEFSDAFMALYRAYTLAEEQRQDLLNKHTHDPTSTVSSRFPYDEVRDWVQAQHNHFEALDRAAERLFEDRKFSSATLRDDLIKYLRDVHESRSVTPRICWNRGHSGGLTKDRSGSGLADSASFESKIFWMAHVMVILSSTGTRGAPCPSANRRGAKSWAHQPGKLFCRRADDAIPTVLRACANGTSRYSKTAKPFWRKLRAGLSSAEHDAAPDLPGIPFYFAKTDIAGNILKRSSATRFQFAQFGGPCPLWNIYRTSPHPGEILVQLASTPEQVTYLNIARTVGRSGGSYLTAQDPLPSCWLRSALCGADDLRRRA